MCTQNIHQTLLLVTKVIFTLITLDAAYIYYIVSEMRDNLSLAAEQYHAVPLMTEHLLVAVVLYLLCMILLRKQMQS